MNLCVSRLWCVLRQSREPPPKKNASKPEHKGCLFDPSNLNSLLRRYQNRRIRSGGCKPREQDSFDLTQRRYSSLMLVPARTEDCSNQGLLGLDDGHCGGLNMARSWHDGNGLALTG